jgi:hypothetical protein
LHSCWPSGDRRGASGFDVVRRTRRACGASCNGNVAGERRSRASDGFPAIAAGSSLRCTTGTGDIGRPCRGCRASHCLPRVASSWRSGGAGLHIRHSRPHQGAQRADSTRHCRARSAGLHIDRGCSHFAASGCDVAVSCAGSDVSASAGTGGLVNTCCICRECCDSGRSATGRGVAIATGSGCRSATILYHQRRASFG